MITAAAIQAKFAPNAKPAYSQALALGEPLLAAAGIITPLRLAHFMAQALHETGAFTILVESGRYSEKGLGNQWDLGNWHRYFANRDDCLTMAERCRADKGESLFNRVYGNRMGNGGPETGDGWKYRGRGILQTTGRESYRRFGRLTGVPFEDQPDLVVHPDHALKPALAEWTRGNLNQVADANDIRVITQVINGGQNGIDERKAWFAKIWPFVTGAQPVEHSREWRVQEALNRAGCNCGEPDGVIGKDTRTAINAFRIKRNLPGPPMITPDLLLALGVS